MTTPASNQSRNLRRLRVCPECDLVIALPALRHGEAAECPRCRYTLEQRVSDSMQRVLAFASAGLLMLLFALPFTFASFKIRGVEQQIAVVQTASALFYDNEVLLALVVSLSIIIFPALFLAGISYLYLQISAGLVWSWQKSLARLVMRLRPWMMADVFLIGVLVSLVKVSSMAEIGFGLSFWAFCLFVVLLLKTVTSIDVDRFWFAFAGEPDSPVAVKAGRNAREQGVTGCALCAFPVAPEVSSKCPRCGEHTKMPTRNSVERTWALILTAAVLYIPANILPVMNTVSWGTNTPQTLIGGILNLAETGSLPVAVIIFFASIVIPIAKLLALSWLCYVVKHPKSVKAGVQVSLYRVTHLIGRWSMIDVFVVATLAALIQAGFLMSVTPGPGILPFASVVIITMIAAMQFDARLLWTPPLAGAGR